MINAKVVEISDLYLIIEYENNGFLEKRYLPRIVFPNLSHKGLLELTQFDLILTIPYTNVDLLHTLGDFHNSISIAELQDALRRAGLWLRDDYKSKPDVVAKVVRTMRGSDKTLDATTVINAALSYGG